MICVGARRRCYASIVMNNCIIYDIRGGNENDSNH